MTAIRIMSMFHLINNKISIFETYGFELTKDEFVFVAKKCIGDQMPNTA